ncbi:MAG: MFS transporter [Candidatus Paceibacterota bacterium]|jgi:MFS family permease
MLIERTHFHFFGKTELNALYATLGLIYFGESLVSVFVPVYLWKLDFQLWQILFFYFLNSLFFVILTFLMLPWFKKLSDKMMMFLSIPFLVAYFLVLKLIPDIGAMFYVAPFLLACSALLFNVGYNLDFSKATDDKKLGREVGTRYTVGALTQFAAPFLGGILITTVGFSGTFFVAALVLFVAVFPLFFFPHHHLPLSLKRSALVSFLEQPKLGMLNLACAGYAMETIIGRVVWPFFIFIAVGSIENLGGVVSVGLLASALATYFVGFLSDDGKRRKALAWTTGLFSFVWVLRLFFKSVPGVVGSHIGGNIINSSLMVAFSSQLYKITRLAPNPSLFILSREVLYQLARVFFLPVLMFLAFMLPLDIFFSVSFGMAAILSLSFLFANKFHSHTIEEN